MMNLWMEVLSNYSIPALSKILFSYIIQVSIFVYYSIILYISRSFACKLYFLVCQELPVPLTVWCCFLWLVG